MLAIFEILTLWQVGMSYKLTGWESSGFPLTKGDKYRREIKMSV